MYGLPSFTATNEVNRRFTTNYFSAELQSYFNVLLKYMKNELSFTTFYDLEKNCTKFDEIYSFFVKLVKEFECLVEDYVKVRNVLYCLFIVSENKDLRKWCSIIVCGDFKFT